MATAPGTGLAVFDPKASAPAHVAHFFDDAGTNIAPRTTVPSLSPEGKTWTISINGQKTKLQRYNTDGDLEPLPIFKAVILDYAKQRGRAYYEGEYDPAKVSAPVCWSDDGVTPDASLPGPFAAGTAVEPGSSRKISVACANCPMAVKGSKVIPGTNKAVTACSQHRMLALVPDPALGLKDIPPLRLKIAMTSDWDKQSPDQEQQGWFAFSNFVDWLVARNVKHTAALVTKMKFDPEAAYPKVFFSAERYLDANELSVVGPLSKTDEVKKLLGGTWTPAGVDGVPKDQQTLAGAQPATDQLAVPPAAPAVVPPTYVMADGETFTEEQYIQSGWTREQLINAGKLVAITPTPAAVAPAPAPAAVAPPPEIAPQVEAIIVGEPAGTVAAPTASAAAASPPAAEMIMIGEPAAPAAPVTSAPEQPAAPPPVQQPAQAAAPPPAAAPQPPAPPAATAQAEAAAPAASADVPDDVAALLTEWQ
jgi:hypothetical protein